MNVSSMSMFLSFFTLKFFIFANAFSQLLRDIENGVGTRDGLSEGKGKQTAIFYGDIEIAMAST